MAALTPEQFDDLERRLSSLGISGIHPLPGGASSVTLKGLRDGRRVVVKVAPPGVAPILHRDVLRQARIIRTLGASGVPVPEVLLEDAGAPPAVPPLFVMSFLDGVSVEPLFDRSASPADPGVVVADRLRNAAIAMAQLHRMVPASVGLGAEPVTSPTEEIERWGRLLETIDPALVPGWRDVGAALRASVPAALPPAVVHGDFRLGNLLAVDDRVTAVIDWEIWSIGDPRIDAGWFLVNADPATYRRDTPYSTSMPRPAELADIYAKALGGSVIDLNWFQGLACFKSTATWSLIVKHNRRRTAPDPEIEEMASVLPTLLTRATEFLDADLELSAHTGL
jgi:aminoglycoside phosphotransferase (APT) family kinase protein